MSAPAAYVSPRTADEPMAFTVDEFLRGTVAAWLWFNALFTVALGIGQAATQSDVWGPWWSGIVMILVWSVPIALIASGIVTLLCCGAAWWLGRALRRERSYLTHAACYAGLGWLIGAIVVGLWMALATHTVPDLLNWFALIVQACSAGAVALGWTWTVRHSLRVEAGKVRPRRIHPDALFEDSL